MRALVVGLILLLAVPECEAQIKRPSRPTPVPQRILRVYTPRQTTLSFTLGISPPVSHDGLTQFWRTGPGGSIRLLFSCSRYLKVGFGTDLSLFYTRKGNFRTETAGQAVRSEDALIWSTYVALRLYARPTLRFSPFIELDFGFSRTTPSVYRLIVNEVPVAHYDLPGSNHLSVGLVGGLDYYLSRKVAIEVDVKGTYVDGSAQVGLIMHVTGGMKFTL